MSTTMSSLSCPALFPKCPRLHLKFPPNALLFLRNPSNTLAFCSSPTRIQLSKPQIQYTHNLFGFAEKNLGVLRRRKLGFCANAENGEEKSNGSGFEGIEEARRQSTMPERFRHLTKEAPDPPLRWPWYIGIYDTELSFNLFVLMENDCRKEFSLFLRERLCSLHSVWLVRNDRKMK